MTRGDWGAAGAIVALALAVRLLGIAFGLPWYHHWDEGWVTDNAIHMVQHPLWEPRIYQYGAPLSWIMGLTVRACGALFPASLYDPGDNALMHLVGRWVVAIVSASGAMGVYLAARWATSGDRGATTRAIYASLAYACSAELVSHGRYAVTDACLVAWVAWALAFGALYVRGGRAAAAIGAVTCAATAVAFKITAGPALLIPAALLAWRRPAGPRWLAWTVRAGALPLAAALFFAMNPHFILHGHAAVNDISTRMKQYEKGGVPEFLVRRRGLDHLASVLYLMTFQVFHRWPAASAILATLSAAGCARALARAEKVCVVGALHAIVVVGGLCMTSRAFLVRNYLVAMPVLCVGAGFALEWLHERAQRPARRMLVASAFGVLFVAVPVGQAIRNQELAVDQRARAVDWIVAQRGSKKQVVVACTPEVARDATADDRPETRGAIQRPGIRFTSDVRSASDVLHVRPDMVLDVGQPDLYGRGESWRFESVPGYREVARFESNPWEHNFDITPTWMGRFDAVVLERQRE